MNIQSTPSSERLHIALVGRRNSGKSSLMNALCNSDVALVSDVPGTTTDSVSKAMELRGLGACVLIDTPGYDDNGVLGEMRVGRTVKAIEKIDLALLLCDSDDLQMEKAWCKLLKDKGVGIVAVVNKADTLDDIPGRVQRVKDEVGVTPVVVSAYAKTGLDDLRLALISALPADFQQDSITGDLVAANDVVMLVMPQDEQAPKGRLIMPQVQTIRELLDKRAIIVSCTPDNMEQSLKALAAPPKLIITDSQVFKAVYALKPAESQLTSFSILMAGYKGDISQFIEGAKAIDRLTPSSRVLIAEACAHAPASEDIGRVKIPRLLRKKVGEGLTIDFVSGADFPQDLTQYDLIIHCGACMFNKKFVLNRLEKSATLCVPMTNYGVAIAHINGILGKIVY